MESVKADKTGNQQANRDEKGKFLPGISPNPDGRPKGALNFTTKVREALSKVADDKGTTYEQKLVKRIMDDALRGNDKLMKLVWNYLDGMPPQRVDMGQAEDQKAISVKIITTPDGAEGDPGLPEELGSGE